MKFKNKHHFYQINNFLKMKKYSKIQEPTKCILLHIWVLMNLIILTRQINSNNSTMIHENLEDFILKGMKNIFTKMNVNYKYKEVIIFIISEFKIHTQTCVSKQAQEIILPF
jgi:hypothetical protein